MTRIQDTDGNDLTPEQAVDLFNTCGDTQTASYLAHLLDVVRGEPGTLHLEPSDEPFDFDRDGRWTT
jgi:hypothetical protein